MRLEALSVELRPRTHWEAVDLGCTMVRAWWRPVYLVWLAVLLPTALTALVLLGGWGLLLLWWLKPLLDRAPLHVLARAVFGEATGLRESLRAMPRLLGGGLLDALPWRRFDPARSFHLPIGQLEGLRGRRRTERARVLDREAGSVAALLTATSLVLELGLAAAWLALPPLLTPEWLGVDWKQAWELRLRGGGASFLDLLAWAAILLSFAALEPFHVGAGFALYLNRRTQLEGWDLEIAFRRLAARSAGRIPRGPTGPGGLRTAAVTAALVGLLGLLPARAGEAAATAVPESAREASAAAVPESAREAAAAAVPESARKAAAAAGGAEAQAQSLTWTGPPERDPRRVAERVLARAEFERRHGRRRWRLREDLFEERDEDLSPPLPLVALLARLAEILGWLAGFTLLGFALVQGLRLAGLWRPRARTPPAGPPRLVAGHDISPESLPADPAAAAERLWREGLPREALGLLYRASLAALVEREGLALGAAFTERDCLEAASRELSAELVEAFGRLTRAWQSAAYAHRLPDTATAAPLWSEWRRHFGSRA